MSDSTPVQSPKKRGIFKSRFLVISILFHVLLALVATYLVVQTFMPRKQTFKAPGKPSNPNQAVEHRVQVAKKQQSMTAPPMQRIATTGLSKVVLPAMPDTPSPSTAPSAMQGVGAVGTSLGSIGAAGPSGGGASIPLFGVRDSGKGLAGTFYDVKQTRNGKPNEFAIPEGDAGKYKSPEEGRINAAYKGVIAKFVDGGLRTTALNRYFVGPTQLYTTQIAIPRIQADRAPEAFGIADKVKPRRWFVVYEGNLIAPEAGNYTFVGHVDDIIAVRFNNRMVLGGTAKNSGTYKYSDAKFQWADVGETVPVQAGKSYPVTIAIGEVPGGAFGGFLFLQKQGVEYQKDKIGNPILPLWKFGPGASPKDRSLPPIGPDTSWSVWKTAPSVAKPASGLLP